MLWWGLATLALRLVVFAFSVVGMYMVRCLGCGVWHSCDCIHIMSKDQSPKHHSPSSSLSIVPDLIVDFKPLNAAVVILKEEDSISPDSCIIEQWDDLIWPRECRILMQALERLEETGRRLVRACRRRDSTRLTLTHHVQLNLSTAKFNAGRFRSTPPPHASDSRCRPERARGKRTLERF